VDSRHPSNVKEIRSWCKDRQLPNRTGRLRFAQREILRAIGLHEIGRALVFKGGNALRIMHGNPRGTIDLDFTASASVPDLKDWIKDHVDSSLDQVPRARGIKMRVQSIERKPPRPDASFPTYLIRVGFCLEGDRGFELEYIEKGRIVNEVVEIEISLNDLVCVSELRFLDAGEEASIDTCTIDDIIAEKLRSLLQQLIRNRSRPQDVYDIAKQWRDHRMKLDTESIRECLLQKCKAREIVPVRSAFSDKVRDRAREDYERLRTDTAESFIEFDDAWRAVLSLVDQLRLTE